MAASMITYDADLCFDRDGSIDPEDPERARMIRVAQYIEYGAELKPCEYRETLISCKKRPGGKACMGMMRVSKWYGSEDIVAYCGSCRVFDFAVTNWQQTRWAKGHRSPKQMEDREIFYPTSGDRKAAMEAENQPKQLSLERQAAPEDISSPPEATPVGTQLARALKRLSCSLSEKEILRLIVTAKSPVDVVTRIVDEAAGPLDEESLNQLMPVIMELWNSMPRPELGNRSPQEMAGKAATVRREGVKVGRNDPCPCGSGRKYKKCCLN